MFNPTSDILERVRRFAIPKLGVLVNYINEHTGQDLYVEGPTTPSQFVGRVEMSEEEFEEVLEEMGFQRNPLASLKTHTRTNEIEEGSFRWLGTQQPPWTADYDDRFQLHVIIYDGKLVPDADVGETYVYAHWEYRWDTDPIKHYRSVDWDAEQGVEMMQRFLDSHGIDYDQQRPQTE